jgi:hypothetical protein
LNEQTKTIDVIKNYYCIHPPHHLNHLDQKNWSPFVYNNTLLLVIYVNPLTVVEMKDSQNVNYLDTTVVSKSLFKEIPWSYGTLRGGTNAVYLHAYDMYLSIFHFSIFRYHFLSVYRSIAKVLPQESQLTVQISWVFLFWFL